MAWKCTNCNSIITQLQYEVSTSSVEWGRARLSNHKPSIEEETHPHQLRNAMIDDFDYDDHGDTEWTDEPEFRCPECDENISLEELEWEEDEDTEDTTPKNPEEPEECSHRIITPLIKTQAQGNTLEGTLICKNCFHAYVYEIARYYDQTSGGMCPLCGTENTIKECKELMDQGFFSNNKNKLCHGNAPTVMTS